MSMKSSFGEKINFDVTIEDIKQWKEKSIFDRIFSRSLPSLKNSGKSQYSSHYKRCQRFGKKKATKECKIREFGSIMVVERRKGTGFKGVFE